MWTRSGRVVGLCLSVAVCLFVSTPVWAQEEGAEPAQAESAAGTDRPSQWQFSLRPYFFLSGVSGSVTASRMTVRRVARRRQSPNVSPSSTTPNPRATMSWWIGPSGSSAGFE